MHSKLSSNCKKKNIYDPEDEPPQKKLISDGDLLIKQLSAKQRNTKVDLPELLSVRNQFYKSTEVVSVTNYTSGSTSLEDFNAVLEHMNDVEQLKSYGLSDDSVQFIFDYKNSVIMNDKHKNLNKAVALERMKDILNQIKLSENTNKKVAVMPTRLQTETTLALKPTSVETKLLKFALQNEQAEQGIPSPMDNIKNVEQKLMNDLSTVDVKKIRKKARSLGRQIDVLNNSPSKEIPTQPQKSLNLLGHLSKWDLKEDPQESHSKNEKVYTCKSENYYTIKNGQIVKLNSLQIGKACPEQEIQKLSIEEIKKLPKFADYEKGTPSRVLYLKNLANGVELSDLENILDKFAKSILSINTMKGKMRGQAFIELEDVAIAEKVLNECNGTFLRNKPIIIQFAKGKRR